MVSECLCQLSGAQLCFVHVALNLAKSDWSNGQRAIRVKNRILGVFPTLVKQAPGCSLRVLHEPVPITITVRINPVHSPLNVRPQALDEITVCRPLVIMASENQP